MGIQYQASESTKIKNEIQIGLNWKTSDFQFWHGAWVSQGGGGHETSSVCVYVVVNLVYTSIKTLLM